MKMGDRSEAMKKLLSGDSATDASGRIRWKRLCLVAFVVGVTVTFFVVANISLPSSTDVAQAQPVVVPVPAETYVYVVTPTYARPVQKAELTRLSHTLRLVPYVYWIVVEDSKEATTLVTNLLRSTGLKYVQLVQPTPLSWKLKTNEGRWRKPRGVLQRNAALKWIRENLKHHDKGVIYFADDDNTYSLELFEEMRRTKKVSIWPVGLVGGLYVEKPIVENGRVVGFNSAWRPERAFPIDMAGFAVSLTHFLSRPQAKFSLTSEGGFQETDFLSLLTTRDQLEPMADNCTKVLVWHTRTEKPVLTYEDRRRRKNQKPSNYGMEI